MKHLFVHGKTLPNAYHRALQELYHNGETVDCPDYNTRCKEMAITFHVEFPLAEPRISRCFIGGHHELQQYVMEVCDGILDFMIGQGDNVWEYTYHDRIKDQIPFVLQELKKNPDSRRAVISVRDNSVDMFNDHPACLQHMQFMLRNNRLDLQVLMRSNDAVEATFMNAFAFIELQKCVADELGVAVGTYTHTANSFHVYEKDWKLLEKYISRIQDDRQSTYYYSGQYEALMKEEIPSILEMVKQQKEKYNIE
ncbi:MAG: thymidylate synthase [Bacillota bacterium]|nr:thymidylate synthase [Bacillota bacterium]